MNQEELQRIIEALIFASDEPMSIERMTSVFPEESRPDKKSLLKIIEAIKESYKERGIMLKQVGSGYRFQVPQNFADWVSKLWEERPARYSRATLETIALIAYRQPITRTEIEQVRGVSVSTNIIRSLLERNWVRVVGHRDVPGKPSLYATTQEFLDYFNLASLEELPPLAELRDIDAINQELDFNEPEASNTASSLAAKEQASIDQTSHENADPTDTSEEQEDQQPEALAAEN